MRRNHNFVILIATILSISLTSCDSTMKVMSKKDAIKRISLIRRGMSFAEVQNVVPLSESHREKVREHGGTWYSVPISENYLVQIRFSPNQEGEDAKINCPPRLRSRHSQALVFEGKE